MALGFSTAKTTSGLSKARGKCSTAFCRPARLNITRRLLRHTQQRSQHNLFRLTLEYFQDGHAFNAFFIEHLLKDRGLADTEPDPQTDRNHDNAEKKRYPPSPNQKLVTGKPAE